MQLFSILSTIFSFHYIFALNGANAAFTTNTAASSLGSSSQSRLFRTSTDPASSSSSSLLSSPMMMMMSRKMNNPLLQVQAQLLHKMTSKDEEEEITTEIVESGASTNDEKGTANSKSNANANANGFLTALLLAPPLIAKFGIVLLVKIATDLVVFPILFFYRLCQTIKAKVVGLVKPNDFKGDNINGAT